MMQDLVQHPTSRHRHDRAACTLPSRRSHPCAAATRCRRSTSQVCPLPCAPPSARRQLQKRNDHRSAVSGELDKTDRTDYSDRRLAARQLEALNSVSDGSHDAVTLFQMVPEIDWNQGSGAGPPSYRRQGPQGEEAGWWGAPVRVRTSRCPASWTARTVSYTHLRAHETRHDLVCRLLLEKK